MSPYAIAQSYIGITEGLGPEDNPIVMEMYASVGHDWVEHDTVAWSAAFVGHCLERAGLRSSRKLNAHSYLSWGVPVELEDAHPSDIVIFARGNTHYWQGHVGFFVRTVGASIEVLGGNHGEEVSVRRYSKPRLLGIRRSGDVAAAITLNVQDVQSSLRRLGYHEVGKSDGVIGSRTRNALLAFRADNNLPLIPIIDVTLTDALEIAQPRSIASERASGKPANSRILAAANAQIGLGALGVIGTLAGLFGASARDRIDTALLQKDALEGLEPLADWLTILFPWLGLAIFVAIIYHAVKARKARIEDHRTGKTP